MSGLQTTGVLPPLGAPPDPPLLAAPDPPDPPPTGLDPGVPDEPPVRAAPAPPESPAPFMVPVQPPARRAVAKADRVHFDIRTPRLSGGGPSKSRPIGDSAASD